LLLESLLNLACCRLLRSGEAWRHHRERHEQDNPHEAG